MMTKNTLLQNGVMACLCFSAAPLLLAEDLNNALDQEPPVLMDELVVQGDWLVNAKNQQVFEHPGARTLVDRDDFKKEGASNVQEALRTVPGVFVPENTGNSDSSLRLGIRGLNPRFSAHTNVLLDGVPLAVAPYGMPHLSIAPVALGNLESIDVVRNGGAVRYGPQNVGGIVNFNTREIPLEHQTTIKVKGSHWSDSPNSTLGQQNYDVFTGGTLDNGLGLALMYSGQKGDSYREHSSSDIDDVILKYDYGLTEAQSLSGRFHYYHADNEMPGGLTQSEFDDDSLQSARPLDAFKGYRKEAVVKYQNEFSEYSTFDVTSYYTKSLREFTYFNLRDHVNPAKGDKYYRKPRYYDVFAIEPRLSHLFVGSGFDQEVSVGYRYLEEDAEEKQYLTPVDADLNPNGSESALETKTVEGETTAQAFYIDDRISFGDWEVTPGIRYEKVRLSVDKPNVDQYEVRKNDYEAFLPSLNVLYRLNDATRLFANYNASFGSVTFNALSKNEDLEEEKAGITELGARYSQGGVEAEITLFHIKFEDILYSSYDQSTGSTLFFNAAEATHQGVELAAEFDLGLLLNWSGFSVFGTYTWLDARFDKGVDSKNVSFADNRTPFAPKHVATLGGRYETGNWTYHLNAYAQSHQYADVHNSEKADLTDWEQELGYKGNIPGFGYVNARVDYQLPVTGLDAVISAGLKNMFNKEYYLRSDTQLAGLYAGAPRQFYVETEINF
ncbi:TonB-dependent siderophore receptor [Litoribacillus peritrichatus]|uniref:Fe(3+) dicitrate transport protein FecA n=1 Tax=Litoribacillus peritrichatus TaxID=718191 RepID=A0ABP7NC34_9GAMM